MLKGKRLKIEDLINVANGETKVIVVSQSGYEEECVINSDSLEIAQADVENHFCEIYLLP